MLATFIGHDGSMGLKHGKVYEIQVVRIEWSTGNDVDMFSVIWQSPNRLYRFFYDLVKLCHHHSCTYTNMRKVKENWDLSHEDWYTAFLWVNG